MSHQRRSIFISVVLLAALLSGCAKHAPLAESSAPDAQAVAQPGKATSSGGSNVRAYIDPATGQLREPTREELAAEAAAEAAKKAVLTSAQSKPNELKEVHLPSGAVAIELGDSAQHPLKACTQPNGDVKMDHECEPDDARKK
jgi:hypothetical protein